MTKKVKIVTKRPNRIGQKMVLPVVGEVQISDKGLVEVPADIAKTLVHNSIGWEYADSTIGDPGDHDQENDNHADGGGDGQDADAYDGKHDDQEQGEGGDLDAMSYTALREVAAKANLPEDEWKALKSKKSMIGYLQSKM